MMKFDNALNEICSTSDVVGFLSSRNNLVRLFYRDKVLFEKVVDFLEEFYSLDQYDLDYEWVKIKSIDDMPDDLDLKVKELILEFESGIDDLLDGNEWGRTYNLTTGEDYGLKTDGLPDSVSLDVYSENKGDELLTIHIHTFDALPSHNDILNCINTQNNVKYVVILAPKEVIILECKNIGVLEDMVVSELDNIRIDVVNNVKNIRNIYNALKLNYIKNPILNKYIKFYWWFK